MRDFRDGSRYAPTLRVLDRKSPSRAFLVGAATCRRYRLTYGRYNHGTPRLTGRRRRIAVGRPSGCTMKRRGHAVQYPPCDNSLIAQVYNMLLDDKHVDSKLLGQVLDACPTLEDKTCFLSAVLLQPPTEEKHEWIEAFGMAWLWTDAIVYPRP